MPGLSLCRELPFPSEHNVTRQLEGYKIFVIVSRWSEGGFVREIEPGKDTEGETGAGVWEGDRLDQEMEGGAFVAG